MYVVYSVLMNLTWKGSDSLCRSNIKLAQVCHILTEAMSIWIVLLPLIVQVPEPSYNFNDYLFHFVFLSVTLGNNMEFIKAAGKTVIIRALYCFVFCVFPFSHCHCCVSSDYKSSWGKELVNQASGNTFMT